MRTPGLAEPARQRAVVGFEKNQRGRSAPPQLLKQRRKLRQLLAFANVDHQRRAPHMRRILGQLGELRDQLDGHVVHRVVAEIFESLEDGGFPGPAQTSNDDELRALRIRPSGRRVWPLADSSGH